MKVHTHVTHYLQGGMVYFNQQETPLSNALSLLCALMRQEYRFQSLAPRGIIIRGVRQPSDVVLSGTPEWLRHDETQVEFNGSQPSTELLFNTALNYLCICSDLGNGWSRCTLTQHRSPDVLDTVYLGRFKPLITNPLLNTQQHHLNASILESAGVRPSHVDFVKVCNLNLDDVICVATLILDGATLADALELLQYEPPKKNS